MDHENMLLALEGLLESERYEITLLSNCAALFNEFLDDINWVGFYLYRDDQLILGPFQGKLACEIIAIGKGVCGTAAARKQTILVEDVHQFPGHIACDSASNSEIVIPILIDGELYGELDIDSPIFARFDETDQQVLEKAVAMISDKLKSLR